MISADIKDLLEALSYLATLLGIPAAIAVFMLEKRRERIDRENETHASAHDRYVSYLTLCLEHPDLDAFDVPKDDRAMIECGVPYQTLILFTIAISMLESAFLRYRHGRTKTLLKQWEGWNDYMKDWAQRAAFRRAWPVIGPQFSADFVAAMDKMLEQTSSERTQ